VVHSTQHEFEIMSNTPWHKFLLVMCTRLEVDPKKTQLAFRLLDDEGRCEFTGIGNHAEWMSVVLVMCSALDEDEAVQIELGEVTENVGDSFPRP
jgi:hypothetical protein